MPSGLYDADGKIRLTQSPGSGFCGRYAPDGSIYFTTAPGSGFCGSTAPDGSMYIVDATGSTTIGVYAPNGAIRVTTGNEYNGAWRVSGVSSVVASWNASTSTLALLAAITTHSRTSLATMFDSTGKLTYAPNNLLTYSNTFSNAAWSLSTATLTSGISDPDGGTSAWTLTATGAGALLFQNVTVPSTANGLFAVWVKRRTGSGTISLRLPAGPYTPITVTGSWTLASIVGPGNGAINIAIQIATSGDAIDIYKAAVSAVTYETTPRDGDQVITTSSAYYGPRIDYDPNTLAVKGLLIEEARTNVALNSNNFGAGTWTPSGVTVTPNAATGPDGTTSASTLAFTTAGFLYAANYAVANGTYTITVSTWLNGTAGAKVALRAVDAAAGTGGGASVLTMTGQLSRFTFTQTVVVTGGSGIAVGFENRVGVVPALPNLAVSVAAYGFQIEPGPFATSYIATVAASVTRAADVVQFTGAALTALQGSAGSAIVELQSLYADSTINARIIAGSQNVMYANGATIASTSNATQTLSTANTPAWTTAARVGVAWSAAGRSIAANGGPVATDAFLIANTGATYLGSLTGASAFLSGWYRSLAIYNQRLADGTLQSKSVVGASY